ncbi:alpha/beta hydrolase [Lentilactobacillus kisonensis]|uniref:Putative esterase n=1 Tax=Lentilactobacillus kisonensis F0435 TaxID=797516 RepID=H1LE09_9LACO|nr:alpha/beta hydrolase-fold protein [Lentilactobacillus kisonensis]EHO52799.1 putative esterase [Lentilactobacillus kisonensis F0435]
MSILSFTRAWSSLQEQTTINVILPNEIPANHKLQVLWLLHGLGDNGSGWLRKTNLEVLDKYTNLAIVTPEMNRSFYTNMANGLPYWDYLTREVIPEMRKLLPLSSDPRDNFVGGVSMGGFGAFKLAFTHPDWFSAVISISSVVNLTVLPKLMPDYDNIFAGPAPKRYLEELAKNAPQAALHRLRIYDCIGDQDFMKHDNDRFVDYLQNELVLNVAYVTKTGNHDWLYWQQVLPDILHWLLGIRLSDGKPLTSFE